MFQIYSIKNLLNIKDKNIAFTENGISMENFKGVYSKIIHAKLSYSPNQCPHCHGKDIIKCGSKTSNIRLLKILEYNSILRLQKQRFRCKDCSKTFSAETDIVDKNCCISNAKISLDRVRLVQLINRSFNKTRIKTMNQCKNKNERYYNKLKKFWSLLLKNCLDLKTERINRGRMFDYALLSEEEMVDIILSKNSELKIAYEIYQELLIAI